jgi:DNA polymerase III subunit delta
MSDTALKSLRETVKRGSFDAAYYICGEDAFQKESATKQLVTAALDPAVKDFNLDVWKAQDLDAKSFDGVVSSMPMMSDRRVMVVRDVGALKKDARSAVERYLEKPSADVLLLLVETHGGKTDRELARRSTVLEFASLAGDRVPRWITHYSSTELGTEITQEAAELLYGAVGNELHQIAAELDKLASFSNGREITEEAVAAVVGIRRGETMADLLDTVARRDVKKSLTLIEHVLGQPKTSAVTIVMALSAQTAALAWGRAQLDEGLSRSRLQGEYFELLKQSGSVFMGGRPWGTAVRTWVSAIESWDQKSLQRSLDALLTADITLKETRFSSEEQVLTTLVLAMCIGDGSRIAA